jgi:hypothetical protein
MQTSRTRLALTSVATLALVMAGTAAVSAHPRDGEDPFGGRGQGRMGPGMDDTGGLDLGRMGPGMDDMGGLGLGLGRLGGLFDEDGDLVRQETVYQTAEGTVTQRVDLGTVTTTGEASLDYSLATGEAASVTTDDATQVISFSTESVDLGRFERQRMAAEEVALADIPAGAEVVVWAGSQADGTYLAQRIVVRPVADATTDSGDADASGDAGSEITEVPASAAPADA